MADLAPVTLDDGMTIWVEVTDSALLPGQSRIAPAGAEDAARRAVETGSQMSGAVAAMCRRVIGSLRSMPEEDQPASAEVEFSLSISLEGNVYVVKGAGEGAIAIRAQWQLGVGDEQPG
jgi:Trypsin-co-occurring domain 1